MALDTNTLADNVDLDNAVANVVPTRGAIVRAEFKARVGIKLLMTLTHNNKPLPFGAMVTSESSQSSGIVADNGQVYFRIFGAPRRPMISSVPIFTPAMAVSFTAMIRSPARIPTFRTGHYSPVVR